MDKMLGILNIESPIVKVDGIGDFRPVSAASFLGRYRILDFMLSNMTNSKINNIELYVKDRPRSTVEHVTRSSYNMNTKHGSIYILGGEKHYSNEIYNTDIANFEANMRCIEESNEPYVLIAPSYWIYTQDFYKMLKYHVESKNDITVLYKNVNTAKDEFIMCDTLDIDDNNRVVNIEKNRGRYKNRNISLEAYIMSRELFFKLIEDARKTSALYWLNDIIADEIGDLKVGVYQHHGFVTCINSLKAYFQANLLILKDNNLQSLTADSWPIYTKFNDDCPTMYSEETDIQNSIVANGSHIEGKVLNSIIGRNVRIKKGAVLKNCVVLPNAYIGENAVLENAIVDRYASVVKVKKLKGNIDNPVYVKRGDRV